jgi:hypothetical protein
MALTPAALVRSVFATLVLFVSSTTAYRGQATAYASSGGRGNGVSATRDAASAAWRAPARPAQRRPLPIPVYDRMVRVLHARCGARGGFPPAFQPTGGSWRAV